MKSTSRYTNITLTIHHSLNHHTLYLVSYARGAVLTEPTIVNWVTGYYKINIILQLVFLEHHCLGWSRINIAVIPFGTSSTLRCYLNLYLQQHFLNSLSGRQQYFNEQSCGAPIGHCNVLMQFFLSGHSRQTATPVVG